MKTLMIVLVALLFSGNVIAGREFAPANMVATVSMAVPIQPEEKIKFMDRDWVNETQKSCIITDLKDKKSKIGCVGLASTVIDLGKMKSSPIILIVVKDAYKDRVGVK